MGNALYSTHCMPFFSENMRKGKTNHIPQNTIRKSILNRSVVVTTGFE